MISNNNDGDGDGNGNSATLHVLFFPLMAPGHMLPMLDLANHFAFRGVKATVLTTPGNAHHIDTSIDNLHVLLVPFPRVKDLPSGCENFSRLHPDNILASLASLEGFREPFACAMTQLRPDCVISDMFFPWTADLASERGVPRILFNGNNIFAQCAEYSFGLNYMLGGVPVLLEESFVLRGLPHHIVLRRSMMPDVTTWGPDVHRTFHQIKLSSVKNFGAVMNTFYELEPDYIDYYQTVMGGKAWHVGPLSLCCDNKLSSRKGNKEREACLEWLDSKEPCSVVYVCFGSMADFKATQLREIALGLESSKSQFIWVLKNESEEWMPQGFKERTGGRGLVIREWAPQILILNHKSVGGFVTHCGWNSCLEGITAGLPFVTWPLFAEQFYNERLVVDVLKIGVAIGMDEYAMKTQERKVIGAARIESAIDQLMSDEEEVREMRGKARELGELARRAVEKDGSSYVDMNNFITELTELKNARINGES